MAGISCASSLGADTQLLTAVGWIRVPAGNTAARSGIFQFGRGVSWNLPSNIYTWGHATGFQVGFQVFANANDDYFDPTHDYAIEQITSNAALYAFDTWHHVYIAMDLSPYSYRANVDYGGGDTPAWFVTSTNAAWDGTTAKYGGGGSFDGLHYYIPNNTGDTSLGTYYEYGIAPLVTIMNTGAFTVGKKIWLMVDGVAKVSAGDDDKAYPNAGIWDSTRALGAPPMTLSVSGWEAAMPCLAANISGAEHRMYANWQIWNKYIPPTAANFAKFIKITGSTATPQNPKLAVSAFGTPVFSFLGDSTTFHQNAGSGGVFAKTGTVTDYTPTPSY